MNFSRYLVMVFFAALLSSCGDSGSEAEPAGETLDAVEVNADSLESGESLDQTAIAAALSESRQKLDAVGQRGFEWPATRELLSQAEDLLAKGDLEQANELAMLAAKQISASNQQANDGDTLSDDSIPR